MIKYKEPNSLSVLNLRRLDFCPVHFEKITFDIVVNEKTISDWLYENTDGRFFSGQVTGDKGTLTWCVGFEIHAECSYFAMQLNQINKSTEFNF